MSTKVSHSHKVWISTIITLIFLYSCSTDWPQFRGSESNMVASGNLPSNWGVDTNIAWIYEMEGSSWSSPIIWEDQVFITTSVLDKKAPRPEPKNSEDQNDNQRNQRSRRQNPPEDDSAYFKDVYKWELTCIDLNSGDELWKRVVYRGHPEIKTHAGNPFASETPVTDGKRVFAYYGMTGVFCFDMVGNPLWQIDLGAYETKYGWGTGSSPVVYNDILYVQVDNEEQSFVVALNAENGNEIWRKERDEETNYSTPVIWENKERAELVVSGMTARSYDLLTGEVYWELNLKGRRNISSPIPTKDILYIGNTGGRGQKGTLFAVKAGAKGDITPSDTTDMNEWFAWYNMDVEMSNPSPLLYKGLIYILNGRGGDMFCYDAATGDSIYKEKAENVAACWASPWAHKNRIFFIDEKGVTHVIKAGREFEILGSNKLDDKFWASPAITRNEYILKGEERIYCIRK